MKKLYSKFIDIGMIENNILYDIQDILYDLPCRLDEDIPIDNNYIINNRIYELTIFKPISEDKFLEEVHNNLYNYVGELQFFITAYKLYILQNKGQFFFKENDDINLQDIISNINSLLKPFEQIYESLVSNIKQNCLNNIGIYKQTYNFEMTQNCPSYIFYFLPIILYFNNIKREDDCNILDFEGNKNKLFQCCIIYFRLYLINNILFKIKSSFGNESYNVEIKKNLLKLIILPLINKSEGKIIDQTKYFDLNFPCDINYFGIFDSSIVNNRLSKYYESFNTIIDNYLYMENYLYDNPNYINENFLIYNIVKINERPEIKEKLIKFYSQEYYLKFKNSEIEEILHNIIKKLVILLYQYPIKNHKISYLRCIDEKTFLPKFRNKINDLAISSSIEDFIRIINEKKEKIYVYNVFSSISGYREEYNNGNITYYIENIVCKPCYIGDELEDLLIQIYPINFYKFLYYSNDRTTYLYQAYEENTIKYVIQKNKIIKILFNGYEVIKFKDINFPFKYLIPNTGFYFIYKKNDIYNISFFVKKIGTDNKFKKGQNNYLFGNENINDGIYTFEINSNTQFFLNKFNSESANFNLWNKLCLDFQVNNYNILYIDFKIEDKIANQDNTGYSCIEQKYKRLCHFNKENIIKESICYNLEDFKLLENNINPLLKFIPNKIDQQMTESYKKLLFKISDCKINEENKLYWINFLTTKKKGLEQAFSNFTNYIKTINLKELLNDINYNKLQRYLLQIKIYNFINKVLINIDKEEILCSLVKNYKFLFDIKKQPLNYKFELLFELISGNEILDVQIKRYNLMIKSYDDYTKFSEKSFLLGGSYLLSVEGNIDDINEEIKEKNCKNNYPLHHFMMGKGKSAIITPLLALYFNIIYKKIIYIIVPKHLVKQTIDTISDYLNIFNIENIIILSEDEVKYKHLTKQLDISSIFLIDEFDNLIKPSRSNFNLVNKKKIEIKDIGKIIKKIIIEFKDKIKNTEISYDEIGALIGGEQIINKDKFIKNILSIINELKNNILKINITWGIDKEKLYAIPYRNKDKPLEKSSFSSIILTVFLTFYYYIIENDYKIDNNIVNFIKKNNIMKKTFRLNLEDFEITIDSVEGLLNQQSKNLLFDIIEINIFNNLLLAEHQYNTSFVDILNIDGIFKIGYSGTVNMNLPILYSNFVFNKKCLYEDEDEYININHAIINKSNIIDVDLKKLFNIELLNSYDALIDVCGYFYKVSNQEIAFNINRILNRDVIFIDEHDNKMIVINKKLEKYNQYVDYVKPFFYYDQSHTVGIDIKQDNYPILKGICIVDKYSIYSEVAQAMYRLRKLNLGHTISFILNGFKVEDKIKLFDVFIKNQKNQIDKEQTNLNFQALKSDIRKKRITPEDKLFIDNYEETKFYYFRQELLDNPLTLLFTPKEIEEIDLCAYELDINDIKNIIYEIDFNCKETNVEMEQHADMEQESIIQQQSASSIYINSNEFKLFNFTNFKDYDFVKNIKNLEDFNNFTFKIDDKISFLPNIFNNNNDSIVSFYNYEDYIHNQTDLILVYFEFKKFLLIPRYMVTYLYNDFLMFDLNLYIINPSKRNLLNREEIKYLEENNMFIKIINNNYNEDYISCFLDINNFIYIKILFFRIYDKKFKNNRIISYYTENKSIINSNFDIYFNTPENINVICYLTPHFRKMIVLPQIGGSNKFFKKYLKYKNKYIQLKNN